MAGRNEELIEKMILNSRSKHKKSTNSKEAKKNNKTSSSGVKIINKYGSTQALLKDADF